jgi:teichuronic acid biosynthesis glycosyltransferase TuaG
MINQKDLVSIITPSYNSARFVQDTLNSVLNQSYQNWEMIIVDDVSSDDSIEVIKKFTEKDNRIKLIQLENNSGAAVARNKAIEMAKGKYIAFLDSDDLWKPEKLEKQIQFMKDNNSLLSYSNYTLIDEEGKDLNIIKKPISKITYKEQLKENQIGCLTAIYDQEKLGKIYMPLIRKRQDYGLWLNILKKIEHADKIDEVLAIYRIRKSSISSNKIEMLKYNFDLFNKHQKLSKLKSFYYLCWNIYRKIRK